MASAEELLRQLPSIDPQHDSLAGCTRAPSASANGRTDADDLGSESSVGSSLRYVRRSEIASGRVQEEEERPSQPEVRYVDRSQLERQEKIKARMLAASGSAVAGSCGSSDLPSDWTVGSGSAADVEKKTYEDGAARFSDLPVARLSELEQMVHAHRAALAATHSPTPAAVCTARAAVGTSSSGCGLFAALGVGHCAPPVLTSTAAQPPAARPTKPAAGQASSKGNRPGAPDSDADDFAEAAAEGAGQPTPTKRRNRRSAGADTSGANRADGRASASKRARRGAMPA
jgi:hypothetical protein